jgi:radical SAM superfamily enzyme YgiQ (UPF0313 family)
MPTAGRRVVLMSLSPNVTQGDERSDDLLGRFPSYGVRRVQASLLAEPPLADLWVTLVDRRDADVDAYTEAALSCEPDVVGMSTYVWSTETFVEVARRIKAARPGTTIVFGGPSAHPRVFDCQPFHDASAYMDALVLGEGEETFREVVALPDRSPGGLLDVPGLAVPTPLGWRTTPTRVPNPDLDHMPSPYQLGLMPEGRVGYVESFRGCPMSCSFCQWGEMDAKRRFSTEYLARELEAVRRTTPHYVFSVDAGINLNRQAFTSLAAAEAEVGLFKQTALLCEVYPSLLTEAHFRFFEGIPHPHFGLGVQSLDEDVLRTVQRRLRPERVSRVVDELNPYGLVDIEIILGLPGDTPETFKRTLHTVLEYPCNVRVYRCLILPDALLTRSPAEFQLRFDPRTLFMTSCHTWPAEELRRTQDYMDGLAASTPGGIVGGHWWQFIHDSPRYRHAYGVAAPRSPGTVESAVVA